MKTADLHFHSTESDGKHSIEWVVETLKKSKNLGMAVLTDHDGLRGYDRFSAAVGSAWPVIGASELSCTYDDESSHASHELHLLVYGIEPHDEEMNQKFKIFEEERSNRFLKICDLLSADGFKINGAELAKKVQGVLGRPHVADALVEGGYAKNREDAFHRFLKDGLPYVVPKWRFPLTECLELAKKRGWKTSIAHPGQYGFRADILQKFRDLGVDAIEVVHPRHSRDDQIYYESCAYRLGFEITGGSDFHTAETDLVDGQPSLGRTTYEAEAAFKFLKKFI